MTIVVLGFVLAGALVIADHLGANATLCVVVIAVLGMAGRRLRVRGG